MKHNTKHSLSFVWRNVKKRDEISRLLFGETLKNVMRYHAKEAVSIILQ